MSKQHIVVTGNAVDGLGFFGPFDTSDDATEWAEAEADEWHITELENPYWDGAGVAKPTLWHVNVYERDREYGGPEEGGWWYDTGTYQPHMSVTFDRASYTPEQVNEHARDIAERLNREADEAQVPGVGCTNYRGGRYLVQTDGKPGRDFPETLPHYE